VELAKITSQFTKLAEDVAANHVFLSVSTGRYKQAYKRVLSLESPPKHPARVVVVVGAGASHAACGLPLGEVAATELKNRLGRVNKELLNEELERLTLEYRLNETDFETQLLALSKFDQRRLLEELSNIFYRKYYPSLSYELLAHMLKHRFLDAIINFNFDELLDQAIEDEVGAGNYYRVVSDGDCVDNVDEWLNDQKRFRLPLYIKPHGTASQKSSLRFTRSLYTLLPQEFRKLLEALFEGEESVKILVLGHGMQSIEFNDILSRYARDDSEILFIDKKAPTSLEHSIKRFYREAFWQVIDKPGLDDDINDTSLDDRLEEFWKAIADCFRVGYKPRQITRHKLISRLFARRIDYRQPESNKQSELTRYLKDRAYVELALAIAKAKGFVHLHQLAEGRTGKYFGLYKRNRRNVSEMPNSLYEMCQSLDLRQAGYSREALRLGEMDDSAGHALSSLIVKPDDLEEALTNLEDKLVDHLSRSVSDRICRNKKLLHDTLTEMYRGNEVEVSPVKSVAHHEAFATRELLPTFTALKEHTMRLLEQPDWDTLLVVAETGQWLIETSYVQIIKAKSCVKLVLIVADETWRATLESNFRTELHSISILPWWLHNQHMTLFLKDRHVLHGIYLERRLRASQIMPLFLPDHDAGALLDTFVAYLMKAQRYSDQSLSRYIGPGELADEKKKFLDELYGAFRLKYSEQSPRG